MVKFHFQQAIALTLCSEVVCMTGAGALEEGRNEIESFRRILRNRIQCPELGFLGCGTGDV